MYKKIVTFLAAGALLVGCSSIGTGKKRYKKYRKAGISIN